jgi:hypothetical protein
MINRLRTASDSVNQLAAACAWHDKEVARIKAEFNAEFMALYKELAEPKAMLRDLQMLDAAKAETRTRDRVALIVRAVGHGPGAQMLAGGRD